MKKLNNKGFGVIEVLLLVVVLGIIGGAGYYVYNSQKEANSALDNAANSQTEPQKSEKKEFANSGLKLDENDRYLVIKEWGVKIPLSSEDKGAYYRVSTSIEQSKSDPTSITVYSSETDSITGTSGVSCEGEYIAYLIRLPSNDARWQPSQSVYDDKVSPLYGSRTIVGSYQYAIATKKDYGPTCLATSSTGDYQSDQLAEQKFKEVVDAFSNNFIYIQAQ